MGTYTFKWFHPADDVYVTGTFDNWSKSEPLDKVGHGFEKKVTLPDASEKIFYKFVVDGNWTTSPDAPRETDHEGNENNVLKPEEIERGTANAFLSNVSPTATTAHLAAAVPLEKKDDPILSGAYPETPGTDLNEEVLVNPIKLAPEEKIPEFITTQGTTRHDELNQELYDKSDAIPGLPGTSGFAPVTNKANPEAGLDVTDPSDVLINLVSPQSTTAALASAVPLESKAGPSDVVINSVSPQSTTAALASAVPLEFNAGTSHVLINSVSPQSTTFALASGVPLESNAGTSEAHAERESSANAGEAQYKAQVERELLEKVPGVPTTSERAAGTGTETLPSYSTLAERGGADTLAESPQAGSSSQTNDGVVLRAPATPSKQGDASRSASPQQSGSAGTSPASTNKKKKNRLSSLFGKLKVKAGKDKA